MIQRRTFLLSMASTAALMACQTTGSGALPAWAGDFGTRAFVVSGDNDDPFFGEPYSMSKNGATCP